MSKSVKSKIKEKEKKYIKPLKKTIIKNEDILSPITIGSDDHVSLSDKSTDSESREGEELKQYKSKKFTHKNCDLPKKEEITPAEATALRARGLATRDDPSSGEDKFINEIIKPPCLIVVAGKSKRGKSYLIKYMLTMLCLNKKFKFGLVFCKTKFNCGYDFIEDNKVIEGYKEDILRGYLEMLQKYGEEHPLTKKEKLLGIKTNIPPSFIVFDDIIGQMDLNAGFMSEFITTYRHYNITLIVATQYLHKVPVLFREQADICVMFYQNTKKSIDACYENYGQEFDNQKKFKNFLIEKTSKPYHCLIYIEDGDDINTKYMEYCAPSDYPDVIFKF